MLNENQKLPADSMYYVYVLIDPRNDQPFYVGKGKGKRVESHYYNWSSVDKENSYKTRKIKKLKRLGFEPKYKIVFESKDETKAYDYEKELIRKWGRARYDKGGTLTNINPGGEGNTGGHRPVKQYNRFGEYIQTFPSCLAAGLAVGCLDSSAISRTCNKKGSTYTKDFFWTYVEESLDPSFVWKVSKPVYQWNKAGEFINRYPTAKDASVAVCGHFRRIGAIYKCCRKQLKTSAGFLWTFGEPPHPEQLTQA